MKCINPVKQPCKTKISQKISFLQYGSVCYKVFSGTVELNQVTYNWENNAILAHLKEYKLRY